jgi:hypothetical protein
MAMEHFPQTWLPIIGKHLRRHLGLSADAPLPASVQAALENLRTFEMARLSARATQSIPASHHHDAAFTFRT